MKRFLFCMIALLLPSVAWGAGVETVEKVRFSMASTVTCDTLPLTKGQDDTKCVPFFSYMYGSGATACDVWERSAVAVWIQDTGGIACVIAQRTTGSATASESLMIPVYVVEFASSVNVYSGQAVSVTGTGVTVNNTDVDETKAFIVTSYTGDATSADAHSNGELRAYFYTGGDSLRLARSGSTGTLTAYWWVVEDTYDNWSVQSGNFKIATSASTGYYELPTSVTMNKTFIIASTESNRTNDDDVCGAAVVDLYHADTVRARRQGSSTCSSDTIGVTFFAVSFTAGGDDSVLRGDAYFPDSAKTIDSSIAFGQTLEDTLTAIFPTPMRPRQMMSPNTSSNQDWSLGICEGRPTGANYDSIRVRVGTVGADSQQTMAWQAIVWEAGTGAAGAACPSASYTSPADGDTITTSTATLIFSVDVNPANDTCEVLVHGGRNDATPNDTVFIDTVTADYTDTVYWNGLGDDSTFYWDVMVTDSDCDSTKAARHFHTNILPPTYIGSVKLGGVRVGPRQ